MPSDVSMSDLLASCAAASAVSTPPADGAPQEGPRAGTDEEAAAERSARRSRHRAPRPVAAR
jgi:hypothetical protein